MSVSKVTKNHEKTCLLLDLDNTLYLKETGLLKAIDHNIDVYMQDKFGIPFEQLTPLRRDYCKYYGTTLGGLMQQYPVNPEEYFAYAYGIDLSQYIQPDLSLQTALAELPWRKIVFSNSPAPYVRQVLCKLGIAEQIEEVYDIVFCDYLAKPRPAAFAKVLTAIGVEARECFFVDDTLPNVEMAGKLGLTALLADDSRQWLKILKESVL